MNTNKLDELRQSAMFNFSLSSKELFHSNVLFWIYNQKEIDLSGPILSSLLPEVSPASESRKYKVFRERHNFDLYFEDTSQNSAKQDILVEVKIKSIPTEEQLERYSAKIIASKKRPEHVACVLLGPYKPDFFGIGKVKSIGGIDWRFQNIRELTAELLDHLEQIIAGTTEQEYIKRLIIDYCQFVEGLCGVMDDHEATQEGFLDLQAYELKRLIECRIHDLIIKFRYDNHATKVRNLLREKCHIASCSVGFLDTTKPWTEKESIVGNKPNMIYISSALTRQNGLLDLQIPVLFSSEGVLVFGVQIQGGQFRILFSSFLREVAGSWKYAKVEKWIKSIAPNILDQIFQLTLENPIFDPKGAKSTAALGNEQSQDAVPLYNKFGDTFRYRYAKLAKDANAGHVYDAVVDKALQLLRLAEQIRHEESDCNTVS